MLSSSNLIVGLVVVVSLAAHVRARDVVSEINQVQERLEAYALGSTISSKLTFDALMSVAQAYEKAPHAIKEAARRLPATRLVIDLAINPMKFIALQIEDDPLLFTLHMNRVERAYKRFRPAYMGKQIGTRQIKLKLNRSLKLYAVLAGKDKDAELTLKMFEFAKAEADTWRARLEELTTIEDIYSSLEELESIFNFFNAPTFEPLFNQIYPSLTPTSDVNQLKATYYDKLWTDHGIKFVNGTPTLFKGAGKPIQQSAGFTHVATA